MSVDKEVDRELRRGLAGPTITRHFPADVFLSATGGPTGPPDVGTRGANPDGS